MPLRRNRAWAFFAVMAVVAAEARPGECPEGTSLQSYRDTLCEYQATGPIIDRSLSERSFVDGGYPRRTLIVTLKGFGPLLKPLSAQVSGWRDERVTWWAAQSPTLKDAYEFEGALPDGDYRVEVAGLPGNTELSFQTRMSWAGRASATLTLKRTAFVLTPTLKAKPLPCTKSSQAPEFFGAPRLNWGYSTTAGRCSSKGVWEFPVEIVHELETRHPLLLYPGEALAPQLGTDSFALSDESVLPSEDQTMELGDVDTPVTVSVAAGSLCPKGLQPNETVFSLQFMRESARRGDSVSLGDLNEANAEFRNQTTPRIPVRCADFAKPLTVSLRLAPGHYSVWWRVHGEPVLLDEITLEARGKPVSLSAGHYEAGVVVIPPERAAVTPMSGATGPASVYWVSPRGQFLVRDSSTQSSGRIVFLARVPSSRGTFALIDEQPKSEITRAFANVSRVRPNSEIWRLTTFFMAEGNRPVDMRVPSWNQKLKVDLNATYEGVAYCGRKDGPTAATLWVRERELDDPLFSVVLTCERGKLVFSGQIPQGRFRAKVTGVIHAVEVEADVGGLNMMATPVELTSPVQMQRTVALSEPKFVATSIVLRGTRCSATDRPKYILHFSSSRGVHSFAAQCPGPNGEWVIPFRVQTGEWYVSVDHADETDRRKRSAIPEKRIRF